MRLQICMWGARRSGSSRVDSQVDAPGVGGEQGEERGPGEKTAEDESQRKSRI